MPARRALSTLHTRCTPNGWASSRLLGAAFVALVMALCTSWPASASESPHEEQAETVILSTGLPGGVDPVELARTIQENRVSFPPSRAGLFGVNAGEVHPPLHLGGDPVNGLAPGSQTSSAVGFDGRNYFVVWEDFRSRNNIFAARMDSSGVVRDSIGILISSGTGFEESPAVSFDGTNFLVVWEKDTGVGSTDRNIYAARVDTSGVVLDVEGIVVCDEVNHQYRPHVAFDGVNYLVVWDDARSGATDIYGARISTSGDVLDEGGFVICSAANSQTAPAVVFDGVRYFVVWSDYRNGAHTDIYGARVSTDGTVFDPGGFTISTANYNQILPRVAFDGDRYLVVWQDYRSGGTYSDIYGARVDTLGAVIDAAGVEICQTGAKLSRPDVSFDGTNYLVVWDDCITLGSPSCDIYGTRVDTSGAVLDVDRIPISVGTSESKTEPCVVFDGARYLVAWTDYRGPVGTDIYGSRVLTDGSVVDAEGILASRGMNNQMYVDVAFGETNYLLVWEDERSSSGTDIFGTRVDISGLVLDPQGIPIATQPGEQRLPTVSYGAGKYMVVWEDYQSGHSQIHGARVDTVGTVLDVTPIPIAALSEVYHETPAVAYNSKDFLVVWSDDRAGTGYDVYGVLVDSLGQVAPGVIDIATGENGQTYPAVASDGAKCLVVWQDESVDDGDIYGVRVDTLGNVLAPVASISVTTGDQTEVDVAFGDTNFFVAWEDRRGADGDIYGARVDTSGTVLDVDGIAISTAVENQSYPSVAFDGTSYLVVWNDWRAGWDYDDIYGSRVQLSGTVTDTAGFAVSTEGSIQGYPATAWGPGRSVLIAYHSFTDSPYLAYRVWGNFWPGPTGLTFLACRATTVDGSVRLSWQVACEVPASSFTVERSTTPLGDYEVRDVNVTRDPGLWFSCVDTEVLPGVTYWYRIVLSSQTGSEVYGPVEVHVEQAPAFYRVYQSYPNPFNPACWIRFDLPHAGEVSLRVYDVTGRLLRTIVEGWRPSGSYTETWNGLDDEGGAVPSGVYFYELKALDFRSARKMVLMR